MAKKALFAFIRRGRKVRGGWAFLLDNTKCKTSCLPPSGFGRHTTKALFAFGGVAEKSEEVACFYWTTRNVKQAVYLRVPLEGVSSKALFAFGR